MLETEATLVPVEEMQEYVEAFHKSERFEIMFLKDCDCGFEWHMQIFRPVPRRGQFIELRTPEQLAQVLSGGPAYDRFVGKGNTLQAAYQNLCNELNKE